MSDPTAALSVSFVANPHHDSDGFSRLLVLDGEVLDSERVEVSLGRAGTADLKVLDEDVSKRLVQCSCAELSAHFDSMVLDIETDDEETAYLGLVAVVSPGDASPAIEFFYRTFPTHWRSPWSIREFADVANEVGTLPDYGELTRSDDDENDMSLAPIVLHCFSPPTDRTLPLSVTIDRLVPLLRSWKSRTLERLANEHVQHSLVARFDFPPEYRTACEKYLIYFGEFLHDLGVTATTDLNHEGAQLIFTVTPESSGQALAAIRDALDVYIGLPEHPLVRSGTARVTADPSVQTLLAALHHLHGDLQLADAKLQLKDATIGMLSAQLATAETRSRGVVERSLRDVTPSSTAEKEPLVPGVISVTRFKGKFFEVELPEIVRRLKRRLKGATDQTGGGPGA